MNLISQLQSIFVLSMLMLGLSSQSQVVVNEYSASNVSTITDNNGEYNDWIELYNAGAASVDLTGYYLSDNAVNPTKWQFPSGTIAASGYLVIWCSGLNTVAGGNYHSNFRLTQMKPEEVIFSDPSAITIDVLNMDPTQKDHSRGRTTDGAGTWSLFTTPTPGAANTNDFQSYAATPTMSQGAGFYGATSISLSTTEPSSEIRYTIDGFEPTGASTLYASAINVSATTVIRARTFSTDPNMPPSFIETNSYFINVNHTVPVVSIAGDGVQVLLDGTQSKPIGSFEFFGRDKVLKTEATGEFNEHGNDSWAYAQRGLDYITRDQYGYNDKLKYKIFTTKNRNKFQRVILKAAANDNYPFAPGNGAHIRDSYVNHLSQLAKLKLDERSWEPCILYVNGQYWGVYDIREKADDHDFTRNYYNQDRYNLQYLKTWGGTWSEYGGPQAQTDWNTLRTFITTNDMAVPANYTQVNSEFNIGSLVDYIILNSYVVCQDWLNWNTAWWRGMSPAGSKKEWRYVLWDMDATFGHYINYTGIPDPSANANPCDPEALPDPGGQGHIEILNALLANDEFRQYYISRFIDLNNTSFKCSNMQALLDSMISIIDPEMQGQITRWGGDYATWQANVQIMKTFIDDRCTAITQGLKDCYDLDGPYDITVDVDPPGSGTVKLNSLDLNNFQWSGSYFGGIDIILKAKPKTGYVFDKWELSNTVNPGDTAMIVTLDLTSNDNIIAHFKDENDTLPEPGAELEGDIFIPNAFSPNNDDNNDEFFIFGSDIVEFDLAIYNRWGEVVFESDDQKEKWDGTFRGKQLNSGVFAYKLRLVLTNGEEQNMGGNITLMR